MLTLNLRKDDAVTVGGARMIVESITLEGFVVVTWADAAGTCMHVLQREVAGAGLAFMVEAGANVRIGLSAKQPNSRKQCRVIFEAPRNVEIERIMP